MKYTVNEIEKLRKKEYPPPKRAFLNFLFYHEIGVLAGNPNVGKTILVNDIINANSTGISFWDEPLSDVQGRCIFVDLDQSEELFQERIHNTPEGIFKGVLRIGVNFDDDSGTKVSEASLIPLLNSIMKKDKGPWLIVIDNISNLIGNSSVDRIIHNLLNSLRSLITRHDACVLLVAHTVKSSSLYKPMTMDRIRGTKILTGLVDSAFCICESRLGGGICYIKHLKSKKKSRYTEVAEVELNETPFLHFRLRDWNEEDEHVYKSHHREHKYTKEQISEVIRYHKAGLSTREIEEITGISKSTVNRIVNEFNSL